MVIPTFTTSCKRLLASLVLLTVTLQTADATSCSGLTKNTCEKTLFLTGSCSSGKCACVSGYEATREGCIPKISPKVSIVALNAEGAGEAVGSGEVLAGGSITLRCEPSGRGQGRYLWMKETESAVQVDQNNDEMTISNAAEVHSGRYMCKVKIAPRDYVSMASPPVTVTVVPLEGTFQERPILLGMLPKSLNNGLMNLHCTNVPSGLTLTYEWYSNGNKIAGVTSKAYTMTITDQVLGQDITCKIVKSSVAVLAQISAPESTAKTTPSSLTGDISGVRIKEGPSVVAKSSLGLRLICEIKDTDLALAENSVSFSWTLNDTVIQDATSSVLNKAEPSKEVDTGLYRCIGKVATKPARPSEPTEVTVLYAVIIGEATLTAKPPKPLEDSYVILDCEIQTRDSSNIVYMWNKGEIFLAGQHDRALQINGMKADDADSYTCTGKVGMDTKTATVQLPAPVAMSTVTPTVTAPAMAEGEQFGVGNTYVLTCASKHHTPGMTYKWLEGDVEISGETAWTYSLKAKSGSYAYHCQMIFDGQTSTVSPALTVTAKDIVSVSMDLVNVSVSQFPNYRPLTGAKVTLKCKAVLAESASGTVIFDWLRDGTVIAGETTDTYSFTAGASTNGAIKCQATLGEEKLASSVFSVTASDFVVAPTLSFINTDVIVFDKIVFVEGASYEIVCATPSHTEDLEYTYLLNGNVIAGPTAGMRTYTLEDVKIGVDDGNYKCRASKGDQSATTADPVLLTITTEGKPCRYDADCEGTGFNGVCSYSNNRCECDRGYTLDGNTCSSAVGLAVSTLLLLISSVLSRLF